jgi:metal iron transporter
MMLSWVISLRNTSLNRVASIHVILPLILIHSNTHAEHFPPAVGILGATVMPHSLFLGSALATQDRVSCPPPSEKKSSLFFAGSQNLDGQPISRTRWLIKASVEFFVAAFRIPPPSSNTTRVTRHADRENNSLAFVKAHVYHGIADLVGSLLGFAVLINSLYMPLLLPSIPFH